jgi:P pilus assembly chaperone PapD
MKFSTNISTIYRFILSCIFTITFSSVIFWQSKAQANLSLAPIYLQIEAKKTQTSGFLTVGNTSDKPLRVRISATAFTYDEEGKFQALESQGEKDLMNYLRFSPKEMTIPPQSKRNVRLTTILPPSFPDGEYRVAIFAESLQENSNSDSQYKVNLTTRIGSAIYIRKGDIQPNLKVEKALFNSQKKELRLTVINNGKATARTKINWQLNQNNQKVIDGVGFSSYLPDKTVNTLLSPNEEKELTLKPGIYQLTGELVWVDGNEKKQNFTVNFEVK